MVIASFKHLVDNFNWMFLINSLVNQIVENVSFLFQLLFINTINTLSKNVRLMYATKYRVTTWYVLMKHGEYPIKLKYFP